MARSKTTKTRTTLTYETLPALFTGICDAIRSKTGGSDPINHQDIPATIANIPTSSGVNVYANKHTTGTLSESYTIEEAGTLNISLLMTYRSAAPTLKKNGTNVAAAVESYNQGSTKWADYWSISVAVGDVITISNGTSVSDTNNNYLIAINTPTS